MIKNIRKRLPKWLGGTQLSDAEAAQAQVMGMALAAMRAAEVNAMLLLQVTQQLKGVKSAKLDLAALGDAMAKLQEPTGVTALYLLAANTAKSDVEAQDDGSIEQVALAITATELFGLVNRLKDRLVGKQVKEAKNENQE